jgi:hypothetical protein
MKSSRFDYVKYDADAVRVQEACKDICSNLEGVVERELKSPRAKALALTKLEEVYMWIGKAVRDDQIARNGSAPLPKREEAIHNGKRISHAIFRVRTFAGSPARGQ